MRTAHGIAATAIVLLIAAFSASARPDSLASHCLSHNPRRLALTDDQLARIQAIVRNQPDGPDRRAAILRVLTRTQSMIYWRTAGIAAC
jgi:hypothetical protein